jgi:hypothetical protein
MLVCGTKSFVSSLCLPHRVSWLSIAHLLLARRLSADGVLLGEQGGREEQARVAVATALLKHARGRGEEHQLTERRLL